MLKARAMGVRVALAALCVGGALAVGVTWTAARGRTMLPSDPGQGSKPGPVLEPVIIKAAKPYDALVQRIQAAGGKVTRQYRHFDGVAALLPRSAEASILSLTGPGTIGKDLPVRTPMVTDELLRVPPGMERSGDETRITFDGAEPIGGAAEISALAGVSPDAYLVNAGILNVASLHAAGYTGDGVVVAVLDSGLRPGFPHLNSDNSVLGGEDFVGDGRGFMNPSNSGHGTFVAGMISANVVFTFAANSTFLRSVKANAPGAVINSNQIPMLGSAPLSKIFALRVLNVNGSGPTSVILAGMDEAITLREAFDQGIPGGVNIKVANMSLSGPTLSPGTDLFDQAVDAMVASDILVVDSASNAGPSGLTIGSPSSSYNSLNVGAASLAHNERILRDLEYGLGVGPFYRPSAAPQTALFSSRGPNADGRVDPDVTASGFASYGQGLGATNVINLASGTSFSSPSVAGVGAVLRQAFPAATARQIRNAILMSANPDYLGDGPTVNDQGAGYADAQAAFDLLAAGAVPDTPPAVPASVRSVIANLGTNAGLDVVTGEVTQHIGPLRPGERAEIYYHVSPNIHELDVTLSNVIPTSPPEGQNQYFGDDLFLAVHSAKTSRVNSISGQEGDYVAYAFTTGGFFPLAMQDTGVARITVLGDWTNGGTIEADIDIVPVSAPSPGLTRQGRIVEGETIDVPFTVPEGVGRASFSLSWREDWADTPVNDVDLILIDPLGFPNYLGATLNNPETLSVVAPTPGAWHALINGFELHTPDDRYKLRILLDDAVVH